MRMRNRTLGRLPRRAAAWSAGALLIGLSIVAGCAVAPRGPVSAPEGEGWTTLRQRFFEHRAAATTTTYQTGDVVITHHQSSRWQQTHLLLPAIDEPHEKRILVAGNIARFKRLYRRLGEETSQ